MSQKSNHCEAADPTTCRYHGTIATAGRFLAENSTPVPANPADVDTSAITVEPEAAAEALARAGITNPPAEFVKAWNDRLEALTPDGAELLSTEQIVEKELGANFDIGRHRGGPELMWLQKDEIFQEDWDAYDPDDFDENGKPKNDYYVQSSPADDWRYDDPNTQVVAVYHTRNGGGNRECWCSDSEEEGHTCTATIVEDLENHPNFAGSYDDSFDSTYANFAFTIPKTEENKEAFRRLKDAQAFSSAKLRKESLEIGTEHPYQILPVNPANKGVIEDLAIREKTLGQEIATYKLPYSVDVQETRTVLAESLTLLQQGDVKGMEVRLRSVTRANHQAWRQIAGSELASAHHLLTREVEKTPALETKIAQLEELESKRSLLASLDKEGKLPKELGSIDTVLKLMEEQSQKPGWEVESYREKKQKTIQGLREAIKRLDKVQKLKEEVTTLRTKREKLKSLAFDRWPAN